MPEINISQLPFMILNFAIAAGILIFFLFKPVLRILQKRKDAVDTALDSAEHMKAEAQALHEENKRSQSIFLNESEEMKEQLIAQGEAEKQKIIDEAKEEAKSIVQQAKTELEEQAGARQEREQVEILRLSEVMAEKVLGRILTEEEKSKSIDDFIDSLEDTKGLLS